MIAAVGISFAVAAFALSVWNLWRLSTERRRAFDVREFSWFNLSERRRRALVKLCDGLVGEHVVGVQRIEHHGGTLLVQGIVKVEGENGLVSVVRDGSHELLRWSREFQVRRRDLPWWWRA